MKRKLCYCLTVTDKQKITSRMFLVMCLLVLRLLFSAALHGRGGATGTYCFLVFFNSFHSKLHSYVINITSCSCCIFHLFCISISHTPRFIKSSALMILVALCWDFPAWSSQVRGCDKFIILSQREKKERAWIPSHFVGKSGNGLLACHVLWHHHKKSPVD